MRTASLAATRAFLAANTNGEIAAVQVLDPTPAQAADRMAAAF